jgi:predicted nucleotidyltransferase
MAGDLHRPSMPVRPRVRRRNLYRAYRAKAKEIVDDLVSAHPGIEGAMLTGGVARGHADEDSELDLCLFLDDALWRTWVEGAQAPVPLGDSIHRGAWVDMDYVRLAAEREREWNPLDLWDRSYVVVLHDPDEKVARLLEEKLQTDIPSREPRDKANCAWWYATLGETWIRRGDPAAAHHIVNKAVDAFLEALFLGQGERVPHDKWVLHLVRRLPRKPRRFARDLPEVLRVRTFTTADVKRRVRILLRWHAWYVRAFADAMEDTRDRALLAELIRRDGSMPLSTFRRRFPQELILYEPLYSVIRVVPRGRGAAVVLDDGAFHRIVRTGSERLTAGGLVHLRALHADVFATKR